MADKFTPEDLAVVEGLTEAYEKALGAATRLVEQQQELSRLTGEQATHAEAVTAASAAREQAARDSLQILTMSADQAREEQAAIQKKLELAKINNDLTEDEVASLLARTDLIAKVQSANKADLETAKQALALSIKAESSLQKRVQIADGLSDKYATILGMSDDWKGSMAGQLVLLARQKDGLSDLAKSMREKLSLENLAGNTLQKVVESSAVVFAQQDAAVSAFQKATGAGSAYNDVIIDTYTSTRTYGVTVADAGEATEALYQNVAIFNQLSKEQQKQLTATTAVLKQFGIATNVTTEATNLLTGGLAMSAEQANDTTRQLYATATALGLPPSVIFSEFAPAAQTLSSHGADMIKVFQGVAAASKATSASMSTLLDYAGQFDTFEGSAQAVGKLNALLGGPYLNTVDMINMKEDERIRKTLEVMEASGKSFATMGKFERMAFANAAGITNMADANKLFNTSLSAYDAAQAKAKEAAMSQEEFNKVAQSAQGITDKLRQIIEGFAVSLEFLIEPTKTVLDGILNLQEASDGWFGIVAGGLSLLGVLAGGIGTVAASAGVLNAAAPGATAGITALGKASANAGKGMGKAAPGIAAFGAAVALIGGGVYLAATGLAEFVSAYKELTPEQAEAANSAMLGFAITLGILTAGIAALGMVVQGPVAVGVAVLGASIFAIGAGVMLAAEGMATFADALGRNLNAVLAIGALLPMFTVQVQMMSIAAAAGGAGLIVLAAGFGALALSMRLLPLDKLSAAADLMGSIASLGEEGVSETAMTGVRKVFTEIEKVDEDKFEEAKGLIQAVTSLNVAAATAGPAAAISLEATNKLLETLIGKTGGPAAGGETESSGRTAGNVYFNDKLVGRWDEDNKKKRYGL